MAGYRDDVPGYQTMRMTAPDTPAAALASAGARQARGAYPQLRFAGGPCFGVAREREEGGWELHEWFGVLSPQDARESMGSHFRRLSQEAGNQKTARKWLGVAGRMDRERLDEVTVAGIRFRVVRAEKFVRVSETLGPEPPRPDDPDPGEPGEAHRVPDPAAGFVIDPVTATSVTEGLLKLELLAAINVQGTVPDDVREDSVRASRSHPGGVLLPAAFVTAELAAGQWRLLHVTTSPTRRDARDSLSAYLRVTAPWQLRLNPAERAVYAQAADRLEVGKADELTVAGRRLRTVRVERLVRVGPDGPEGPRPSDHDPQPPVLAGGRPETSSQESSEPPPLDEEGTQFQRLFREEEERLRARRDQQ